MVDDLRFFDVSVIQRRSDPKAKILADKINETLVGIFGRDSPEYDDNCIWSLDTLPITIGGSWYPLPEVREAYQKGLNSAITKLTTLIGILEKNLKSVEGKKLNRNTSEVPPVQSGAEKISLLTIRGKLRDRQTFSLQAQGVHPTASTPPLPYCPKETTSVRPAEDEGTDVCVGKRPTTETTQENPNALELLEAFEQPLAKVQAENPVRDQSALCQILHDDRSSLPRTSEERLAQSDPSGESGGKATNKPYLPPDPPIHVVAEALIFAAHPVGPTDMDDPKPDLLQQLEGPADEPDSLETLEKKPWVVEVEPSKNFGVKVPGASQRVKEVAPERLLVRTEEFQIANPAYEEFDESLAVPGEEEVVLVDAHQELGGDVKIALINQAASLQFWDMQETPVDGDVVAIDGDNEIISDLLITEDLQQRSPEPETKEPDLAHSKLCVLGSEQDDLPVLCGAPVVPSEPLSPHNFKERIESLYTQDFLAQGLNSHHMTAEDKSFSFSPIDNGCDHTALPMTEDLDASVSEEVHLGVPEEMTRPELQLFIHEKILCASETPGETGRDETKCFFESIQARLDEAEVYQSARDFHEQVLGPTHIGPSDDIPSDVITGDIINQLPHEHSIHITHDVASITAGLQALLDEPLHEVADQEETELSEVDHGSMEATDTETKGIEATTLSLHRLQVQSTLRENVVVSAAYRHDFTPDNIAVFVENRDGCVRLPGDSEPQQHVEGGAYLSPEEVTIEKFDEPILEVASIVSNEMAVAEAQNKTPWKAEATTLEQELEPIDDSNKQINQPVNARTQETDLGTQLDEPLGIPDCETFPSDPPNTNLLGSLNKALPTGTKIHEPSSDVTVQPPGFETEKKTTHSPFDIPGPARDASRPRKDGLEDMGRRLAGLRDRIDELASFDVKTIKERFDPRAKALSNTVNSTLADIFGQNTPAYWQHAIPSLDTLPGVVGGPKLSPYEMREVYQKGINDATTKLRSILETIEKKQEGVKTDGFRPIVSETSSAPSDHKQELIQPSYDHSLEKPLIPAGTRHATLKETTNSPFDIPGPARDASRPRKDGLEDMGRRLAGLRDRIDELASFDVKTIKERFDPRAKALSNTVNSTLADIFGQNTPAYWQHAIPSLDTLPGVVGGPKLSPHEIREVYRKGIKDATTKLRSILETMEKKQEDVKTDGPQSGHSFTPAIQGVKEQRSRAPGPVSHTL